MLHRLDASLVLQRTHAWSNAAHLAALSPHAHGTLSLLADIAPLLPGFVAACNISQMLYITPLLVTTLTNYPEELSIQLQVV